MVYVSSLFTQEGKIKGIIEDYNSCDSMKEIAKRMLVGELIKCLSYLNSDAYTINSVTIAATKPSAKRGLNCTH